MQIDFQKIAAENVRKYGTDIDRYGPVLLANLYSDRTHFVYELLQNAEDAGASSVTFSLFPDRLEFRHDGRPFNENDVRGICGLVEGTKSGDLSQIGKFGIGFKSVYAYTNSPEVHNGDQHFCIQDYVIPKVIAAKDAGGDNTLFVFPFDRKSVSPEEARGEIHERLSRLGSKTLLFLRNITCINWRANGEAKGSYRRTSRVRKNARQVTLQAKGDFKETEERWLVFRRPVVEDKNEGNETIYVEVAFCLQRDKSGSACISRVSESPLVVFFPTEKETHLGFLLQGPYITTPARDNVPERHPYNVRLVDETALLVRDSLFELKNMGMLSAQALEAMPLEAADFSVGSMFHPIFQTVRHALLNEELLPAFGRGYVTGKSAKLARGSEMAALFNPKRLQLLLGLERTPRWLSTDISENKTPELYTYLVGRRGRGRWSGEEIEPLVEDIEVRPEHLLAHINEKFMSEQTDAWVKKLYVYLGTQRDLHGMLRTLPILRLRDGKHVAAQSEDGQTTAFMPSKRSSGFPTIKPSLVSDTRVKDFLRDLGVREPDNTAELMQSVLAKYLKNPGGVGRKEHAEDIEKIASALRSDSPRQYELRDALKDTPFLCAQNARNKKRSFRRPNEIYSPTENLQAYFDGYPGAWFLCEPPENTDLWLDLGLRCEVDISCRQPGRDGHVALAAESRNHKRGLDGFDPDCTILGLEHALETITVEKAQFIWNCLLLPHAQAIRGWIESALWHTYKYSHKEQLPSAMGRLVIEKPWLPGMSGKFQRPDEMCTEDLLPGFEVNELLVKKLGMRLSGLISISEEIKIPLEHLDLLRESPGLFEEFLEWRNNRLAEESEDEEEFPSRQASEPSVREEKKSSAHTEETHREYQTRQHSVRVSGDADAARTYLESMYSEDRDSVWCQLCHRVLDESSFRKRDGKPYFEAVEIFPNGYLTKEDAAAYALLCPLCAAKYRELIKKQKSDSQLQGIKHRLLRIDPADVGEKELTVKLELNGRYGVLRFVGKHWTDLRGILRSESDNGSGTRE